VPIPEALLYNNIYYTIQNSVVHLQLAQLQNWLERHFRRHITNHYA